MSALAVIQDTKLFALDEWGKTDTMTSVGRVRTICDELEVDILAIDDAGVGGAITDRLMELYDEGQVPFEILPVNNGTKAAEEEDFHNKGSEIWWRVRESLDPTGPQPFSFPQHHPLITKLASQLQKATYTHDSKERIWVDKTGMRGQQRRVGDPAPPSPDLGDAFGLSLEAWSNFWDAPKQERVYHTESFLSG